MKTLLFVLSFILILTLNADSRFVDLMRERSDWRLPGCGKWLDGNMLEIHVPQDSKWKKGMNTARIRFPVETLRGKNIRVSGEACAEKLNLAEREQPYYGFKFMLIVNNSKGDAQYPAAGAGMLTDFEWKNFEFETFIPRDAADAELNLGLQNIAGKVCFRNIRFEETPSPYAAPFELPENFRCEYSTDILEHPMRRGVMSPFVQDCTEADLDELARWGGDLIRWQIGSPKDNAALADTAQFEAWYAQRLDELEKWMPTFERLGIYVVIDMHTPPGGRYLRAPEPLPEGEIRKAAAFPRQFRMFMEDRYFESYLNIWRNIAERFKDQKMVWGYDLCNEPCQQRQVRRNYLECQYRAAQEIRKIDSYTPIIVESNGMCSPDSFWYLEPLPLKNIIYQVHMYVPLPFTHQGVNKESEEKVRKGKFIRYPECVPGGKEGLRKTLAPVRQFQEKYGAVIYCGEFSAIRWAPGAAEYLRDVIDLFEEYRWPWTYHAFREWQGWSVEHGSGFADRKAAEQTTDRKKVLLDAFRKNQRQVQRGSGNSSRSE